MDQIEIRLAVQEEAPFISLLGRVTFSETFGHFFRDKQDLLDYCEATFSVDKIERSIGKQSSVFWLAYVNRLPVGYAKLKLDSKSEFLETDSICQLQKIYVLGDFLSMKIGLQLQNALLEKARELGFEKIWLSVLDSNERAIRFYERGGFETLGKYAFQIGKEHFEFFAMGKDL